MLFSFPLLSRRLFFSFLVSPSLSLSPPRRARGPRSHQPGPRGPVRPEKEKRAFSGSEGRGGGGSKRASRKRAKSFQERETNRKKGHIQQKARPAAPTSITRRSFHARNSLCELLLASEWKGGELGEPGYANAGVQKTGGGREIEENQKKEVRLNLSFVIASSLAALALQIRYFAPVLDSRDEIKGQRGHESGAQERKTNIGGGGKKKGCCFRTPFA